MTEKVITETYPNQAALQSLDLVLKKKSELLVIFWLSYISLLVFVYYVLNQRELIFKIGIPLFIIYFIISYKKSSFKSKDYYSLPASKTDLAIHKCIYCGNDEIKTEQILLTKVHRCEQCKEFLYTE